MTKGVKKQLRIVGLVLFVLGITIFATTSAVFYQSRIYPNTSIARVKIGNLKKSEAQTKLQSSLTKPTTIMLIFTGSQNQQQFSFPSDSIGLSIDYESSVNQIFANQTLKHFLKQKIFKLSVNYDQNELFKHLDTILAQVGTPATYPGLTLDINSIEFQAGEIGFATNKEVIIQQINQRFEVGRFGSIIIELAQIDPRLTEQEKQAFIKKGQALIGKQLILEFEDASYTLSDKQIINALSPDKIYEEKLQGLIEQIETDLNREPQNPKFVFENNRVEEFAPAKSGVYVQSDILLKDITEAINNLAVSSENSVSLAIAVKTTSPDFNTSEVNNLGINELIGRGHSTFRGSISSRIYNVNLAAIRVSGTLVKPGEVFSFNKAVGDISALTGYKQAYVIRDGQTVLGDGGGVCQVSTTLFRAILDAGLPIIERRAHSYRVGYYEQGYPPGLDATIYAPTTDLKFKNDTGAHVLIQAYPDTKNLELVFELYGTSDGRVATTTKPVINSSTPPPEDKYIDDPSLPAGEIKQIEYKAWGAKVSFSYTVTKGGETIHEKTFYSNYKPWGAVFLRGTGGEI